MQGATQQATIPPAIYAIHPVITGSGKDL
ncbi:hypothetical protein EYZ11_000537 [Aspergillus tanneri]|uniref:Uncharacterized protein n=1 Tax=Aspergillus tanneri TaxID=1220188 RepID=A0A4S3JWT2_9EURO|nr:hypothetical protein EYZ11_000537 [Aspergillus tanneri]